MSAGRLTTAAVVLAAAIAATSTRPAAAQSNIRNADLQERAAGDLARTVQELAREAGPLWIGYAVAAQDPEFNACCNNSRADAGCCGRCSIEEKRTDQSTIVGGRDVRRSILLEGNTGLVVLLRVLDGQLERVRSFSQTCEIDAGGRRVYWLTGVQPAASVKLLETMVETNAENRGTRGVVTGALVALAAHGAPEATDALIALAKLETSGRIRGEALFWLAHKAGRKAAAAITDAIDNDPDTKVKEQAVFALSQLPKDDGVPKLIEVARTHRNPKVRQQAMFWLGQSRDARALKFFEEILLKQ